MTWASEGIFGCALAWAWAVGSETLNDSSFTTDSNGIEYASVQAKMPRAARYAQALAMVKRERSLHPCSA